MGVTIDLKSIECSEVCCIILRNIRITMKFSYNSPILAFYQAIVVAVSGTRFRELNLEFF